MVLMLDPRLPPVWRTPDSLQFGVDEPALVLDGVSVAEERMLAALAGGATREGLELIAVRSRASRSDAGALLDRIAPALASPPPAPSAAGTVVIDGVGPTAAALHRVLAEAGVRVRTGLSPSGQAVDRADAAVVVAAYAVEPRRHARWLRRDIPHLPIVYSDGGVTVGPLVRPGAGACLRCLDLHRTDADPAWPAMATQLHTRTAPGETAVAAAAAAARAAAELLALLAAYGAAERGRPRPAASAPAPRSAPVATRSARLAHCGTDWVSRAWEPHPACGCLAPPS